LTQADVKDARHRVDSRRRSLQALAALPLFVVGWMGSALAATPKRLGILAILGREEALRWYAASLRKHLADFGWIEGKTLAIEWRFAQLDDSRYAPFAKELVEARVDVIATWGTAATRAAQQATRTIPIVTGLTDPVGYGRAETSRGFRTRRRKSRRRNSSSCAGCCLSFRTWSSSPAPRSNRSARGRRRPWRWPVRRE